MALPVVTVASGGLPIVDVTASKPGSGLAVTEAANGRGLSVTKVASGGMAVTYVTGLSTATLDPATAVNATLSADNLTATHINGAALGGVKTSSGKNAGTYYFEMTLSTASTSSGVGLMTPAATYTNLVLNGTNCAVVYQSGAIWSNNANTAQTLGALANGDIIGVAVDFTNQKVWFRKTPSGNWNGVGANNPATNTGGVSISAFSATTLAPAIGWSNVAGGVVTSNFGASSFSGAVPSGFTAGWG